MTVFSYKLQPPVPEVVKRYALLAGGSYVMNDTSMKLEDRLRKIQKDYALRATPQKLRKEVPYLVDSGLSDKNITVYFNFYYRECVIACRGTSFANKQNARRDIMADFEIAKNDISDSRFFDGRIQQIRNIIRFVRNNKLTKGYKFTLTGHSLGGTIAYAAFTCCQDLAIDFATGNGCWCFNPGTSPLQTIFKKRRPVSNKLTNNKIYLFHIKGDMISMHIDSLQGNKYHFVMAPKSKFGKASSFARKLAYYSLAGASFGVSLFIKIAKDTSFAHSLRNFYADEFT